MGGILVLEDNMERIHELQKAFGGITPIRLVHNAKGCIQEMMRGHWDFIFLQHDIGEPKLAADGVCACAWAGEHPDRFHGTTFILHTENTFGGHRMQQILHRWRLHAHRQVRPWAHADLKQHVITFMKRASQGSV